MKLPNQNVIDRLLQEMTLTEKAMICSGKDFWHLHGIKRLQLPSIMVTDGPHGMRKQTGAADHVGLNESVPATCFPTASGLAATWDRELLEQIGVALGRECRAENVSVLLGPGINIKRHPLGGRNFEYFSEDPMLSGEMAKAWIRGVQSQHVGTSLKHYAANNHEQGRMVVDVVMDERTLREIYLPAFEACVKDTQPWTIMCSYNKLNGTYVAEHSKLLTKILQDEWGYEGLVVTDWGANHDRVAGIKSGQGLEMPGNTQVSTRKILDAIKHNQLTEAELDTSVARVVGLMLKAREVFNKPLSVNHNDHHELARRAAEQCCVLLKNDHQLLPLEMTLKTGVIGALATDTRYQGSGSSQINPTCLEQPLKEIQRLIGNENVSYASGYPIQGNITQPQIAEALHVAESCDQIILIVGLTPDYESEGFDRDHMQLPDAQLTLIEALAPYYHKLVVVLQNGAPVELPFADKVPAIIEAYLGGQAGASALANIVFGKANPSGKLAETFPLNVKDVASNPWFPGELRQSQYRESIWIGYRYFDSTQTTVAYPFGHGLSYTHFDYSDLTIETSGSQVSDKLTFSEQDQIRVSFTITNGGDRSGAEIAQLYIGQKQSSVHRPAKELKRFSRVSLEAGESRTVTLTLCYRDFAFWCVDQECWLVESDSFTIAVGASSADIRLQQSIYIDSGLTKQEPNPALAPYFHPDKIPISNQAFEALLGHSIPDPIPGKPYQINSTLGELQGHWLGRMILKMARKQMLAVAGENDPEQAPAFIEIMLKEMPLRAMMAFSNGKLSPAKINALIHIMNGDWGKLLTARPARSY